MSIVIDSPYSSTRGRKPSRPAFGFYFHNDTAGGTSVTDRFGNAAALSVQGTLGTAWTASRGFLVPNGSDLHLLTGTTNEYAGQTVCANALLTVGQALIVAAQFGWSGVKNSSNEVFLCIGRSTTTTPVVALGLSSGALANVQLRGVSASAISSATFGNSGNYSATANISLLWHLEATATGVNVLCFKDGASIGSLATLNWTANSGSVPTAANFAMPDGITIGAMRGGSSGSPTWSQRVGATTTAGGRLGYIVGINLAAASAATAADLALEMHQYPRHIGEVMAAI